MAAADGSQLESPVLAGARAEFAARLAPRLRTLRRLSKLLEQSAESAWARAQLEHRLVTLHAAASVLGFERVAAGFEQAERLLAQAAREFAIEDLVLLRRILGRIPSLAWEVPVSVPELREPPSVSVLALIPAELGGALEGVDPGLSLEFVSSADELGRLLERSAADAVLIDAEAAGGVNRVEELLTDQRHALPAIVLANDSIELAPRLLAKGAGRIVPKPTSLHSLSRLLRDVTRGQPALDGPEPLGELTVPELGHRLAAEVRHRLVDAMDQDDATTRVSLGDGAEVLGAVWDAVARVQNTIILRSGGAVRFDPRLGQQGDGLAWPDAPRTRHRVELRDRRAVVADDDPAMVWFLSSLLTSAGVEVLEAYDGRTALELVMNAWPDFVLTDVLMPRLDGCSLCREVKRDLAVRDVPVLLCSWKEDLLHHVRDLGVGADAYLTKRASATTVLDHIRRTLWPRAHIEAQLDEGAEVSGPIDGLTPRLLLTLAANRGADVELSVQDAVFLCEAEVRQGRLRCVTRSSTHGHCERGRVALSRLLGMSAGRFRIVPRTAPCANEFEGSLPEVLAPHIAAARAALRALDSASLLGVERLVLDEAAVATELRGLPGPMVELLVKIRAGAAPRELYANGAGPLLEAALTNLARRGLVLGVYGPNGVDLLGPAADALPCAFDPDTPGETPSFSFHLTPAPAELSDPLSISEPLERWWSIDSPAQPAAEECDQPEASAEDGETTESAPASAAPLAAELQLPAPEPCSENESSSLIVVLDDDDLLSDPGEIDHAALLISQSECPEGHEQLGADRAPPGAPGVAQSVAQHWRMEEEPWSDSEAMIAVGSLVTTDPWPIRSLACPAVESAPGMPCAFRSAPMDEVDLGWDELMRTAPAETARPSYRSPAPPAAPTADAQSVERPMAEPELAGAAGPPEAADSARIDSPTYDEPDFQSADFDWDDIVVAPAPSASSEGGLQTPAETPESPPPASFPESDPGVVVLPATSDPIVVTRHPALPTGDLHELFLFATQPPPVVSDQPDSSAMPEPIPLPVRKITLPSRLAKTSQPPAAEVEPTAPSRRPDVRVEATPLQAEVRVERPNERGWLRVAKAALITAISAAACFSIVRWWAGPRPQSGALAMPSSAGDPAALASAAPLASLGALQAKKVAEQARVQEGALPAGATLPAGKGLLEVSTGDRHAIYIDQAFVGLGPVRPAVLEPGQHRVRVKLDAVDHTFPVSVTAARLVRLDVAAP